MRWWVVVLVWTVAGQGFAAEPAPRPLCGEPAILRQVVEALDRTGRRVTIEPGSVGESPGRQVDRVRCALRVHSTVYDTARFGAAPQDFVRVVQYSLDLRRNGVFVRIDS